MEGEVSKASGLDSAANTGYFAARNKIHRRENHNVQNNMAGSGSFYSGDDGRICIFGKRRGAEGHGNLH